jgi:hypothetical protein
MAGTLRGGFFDLLPNSTHTAPSHYLNTGLPAPGFQPPPPPPPLYVFIRVHRLLGRSPVAFESLHQKRPIVSTIRMQGIERTGSGLCRVCGSRVWRVGGDAASRSLRQSHAQPSHTKAISRPEQSRPCIAFWPIRSAAKCQVLC